jgi:hypothetical protein
MPVHDWTRVFPGIFHHFHHEWISTISHAINRRLKGSSFYALAEQIAGGLGPDVLTLQAPPGRGKKVPSSKGQSTRGVLVLTASPPRLRYRLTDEKKWYAAKKKAVTIRHVSEHKLVAVLEILSSGNKASRGALDDFVRKAHELLQAGVHFAVVDLFPPTPRDPGGIHPILWGEDDDRFHFDPARPMTCASYRAGPLAEAFVEPVGVGDKLPELPVFLVGDEYVPVPLETTYQAAFEAVPDPWREALTTANRSI